MNDRAGLNYKGKNLQRGRGIELKGSAGKAFKPSIPRKVKNQNTPGRNRSIEKRRDVVVTARSTRGKLIVREPRCGTRKWCRLVGVFVCKSTEER